MNRKSWNAFAVLGFGLIIGAGLQAKANGATASPNDGETRTQWDGVYAESQAQAGKDIYLDKCVTCHAEDLSGDTPYNPAPALAGKPFLASWDRRSVNELFEFMSKNMPKDAPASLEKEDYIKVIAFIFQSNKFPAGKESLTPDEDALKKIIIVKEKKK
jgi:cytochrome c